MESRLCYQRLKEEIKAALVFALKKWTKKHQLSRESPVQVFDKSDVDWTNVDDTRDFLLFKFSEFDKIVPSLRQFFSCLKNGVKFELDSDFCLLDHEDVEHIMYSFGIKVCSMYSAEEGFGCFEEILRETPDLRFTFPKKLEDKDEE